MKCPKCGYHSFEHLESCKKCGVDLSEHKAKFSIRGFFAPGQVEAALPTEAEVPGEVDAAEEGDVDFGFDFLEEDEAPAQEPPEKTQMKQTAAETAEEDFALDQDGDDVNLDQPFGVDGESVPADKPGKKDPGSEFSF